MSNQVCLVGEIGELTHDHNIYGENFYKTTLTVKRDSGNTDIIPLLVPERVLVSSVRGCVGVKGEFRSYNDHSENKTKLKLYVYVTELEMVNENTNINDVFLEGYICKVPVYRKTPLGREICDVMLAINRDNGKSDYIPCVFWGKKACYVKGLEIADCIRVAGRIQSREYTKDGIVKTAYELSVNLFEFS